MRTFTATGGARLAYDDVGSGPAVLALHGAYSTHEEIRGFLDPLLPDRRRIYPDLPGMGDSTAEGMTSARDVVAALVELVDEVVGEQPVTIIGHSFGAHLARGVAAALPNRIRGLGLLCPLVPGDQAMEPATVVADDGSAASLPPDLAEAYTGYFVVRTAATLARFHAAVAPVLGRWDSEAVERAMSDDTLDLEPDHPYPVLVVTGRQDAWVGYRQHAGLLEAYPQATSLVLADAGHALPHERPEMLAAVLQQWLVDAENRRA